MNIMKTCREKRDSGVMSKVFAVGKVVRGRVVFEKVLEVEKC